MQFKNLLYFLLLGSIGLLCVCGKGKKQQVLYGSDSLSIGTITALMPPMGGAAHNDSALIRQALFRHELSKTATKPLSPPDSSSIKLARRLTLQSGVEWSPEAASLLLTSAEAIAAKIRETKDMKKVLHFIDSVYALLNYGDSGSDAKLLHDVAGLEKRDLTDAKVFCRVLSAVLGISAEEAATLASFVSSGGRTGTAPSANIDKMVKGILNKSGGHAAARADGTDERIREQEQEKSKNALLALQYRPAGSIRDSIARHQRYLEGIYKKQLKLNERAGGLVWVVFQVDASGSVLSAKIKSSAIANPQFRQLLEEYVRTIRFKAIPANMEPMIFEFPFEFKAEGL